MNLLQHLFLESALYLGVFSFLLFAVVLLTRSYWPAQPGRYALPAVLLLIVLLFTVQKLVMTQREEILRVLEDFVAAIDREDIAALSRAIGQGYDSEEMDHDEIIRRLEGALKNLDIYDVRFRRRDVEIGSRRAEMILGAMATVRIRGEAGGLHTGRWQLGWAREADGWRIVSIRPEMIDTIPIKRMQSLLRTYGQ